MQVINDNECRFQTERDFRRTYPNSSLKLFTKWDDFFRKLTVIKMDRLDKESATLLSLIETDESINEGTLDLYHIYFSHKIYRMCCV